MKPSLSAASAFPHQISPSPRSPRPGEPSKSKNPQETRDSSERRLRKLSRSPDEGRSSGRNSRPHSSSASLLFSQQNVTFEDIAASTLSPIPASPTMSTSRPASTAKPNKSTTRTQQQALVKAVAQQAASQQPKVEDDVGIVTATPTLLKSPTQNFVEAANPHTRSSTPAVTSASPSIQKQMPSRLEQIPFKSDADVSDVLYSPLSALATKDLPIEAKSQPGRSLDDSLPVQINLPPTNPGIATAAPAVSPPHSPRLYSYNPYNYSTALMAAPPPSDSQRSSPAPMPPQNMPPLGYGYMPMMTGGPPPPMYGHPYYGLPFSPPAEPLLQSSEGCKSPSSAQDEHQQLLEKVAGALPDIHRLLSNYKDTHGQLSAREQLAKQADLSYTEQLAKVRVELEANKNEYEKVIQNLVDEKSKLERELTGVRQRVIDVEKSEAESKALRAELEMMQGDKKGLSETIDALKKYKEEMQNVQLTHEKEIDSLKKALEAEKEFHNRHVIEAKEQAREQFDVKQKEYNKTIGDYKLNHSKTQLELTSLLSKHNQQKKDLDLARSAESDYKIKLELKSQEFEEAVARHSREIDSTKKKHAEEQERLVEEGEERLAKMNEAHLDKERKWQRTLHDLRDELESEKAKSQRLGGELETSKKANDAEKVQRSAELVESLALWRAKSDELQKENRKLDRLLQGLGCATELKSKGNDFFQKAFRQLAEQITNVSRGSFVQVPCTPPSEKLLLIPDGIPTFMDITTAATEIRACYIQHIISSILLFRIFRPFLFTLGRRYGGVDTFLQSLSTNIRHKSSRREAVWRQTTLQAAYTVSKAREAINVVATVIVDEIVDEIKHFAHQSQWPVIIQSVQRIVKSAAEVWRLARIERELIHASMPDLGAVDVPERELPEPRFDGIEAETPEVRDMSKMRQVILCLLPHIIREPVHKGFLGEAQTPDSCPCIYLQGQVLYADSPVVLARRRELS